MIIRNFFVDNFFLSIAGILTQILWFLFKTLIIKQFSDFDYSFFIVCTSTLMTFQFFGHLNLFKSMSIKISKRDNKLLNSSENRTIIRSHFTIALILTLIASLTLCAFIYLNTNNLIVSLLFGIDLFFENLILFFYFVFLGFNKVRKAGIVFSSTNVLRVGFLSLIIFFNTFYFSNFLTINLVVLLYVIGAISTFVITFFLAKKQFLEIIFPINRKLLEIFSDFVVIKESLFLSLISIIIQGFSTLVYFSIREFDVTFIKEADVSLMFFSFLLISFTLTSLLISVNPKILGDPRKFLKDFQIPITLISMILTGITIIFITLDLPIMKYLSYFMFDLDYKDLKTFLIFAVIGVPFHTIYVLCMGFFVGNNLLERQFFFNMSAFLLSLPILVILSSYFGAKGSIVSYTIFSIFLAFFSLIGILFYSKKNVKFQLK